MKIYSSVKKLITTVAFVALCLFFVTNVYAQTYTPKPCPVTVSPIPIGQTLTAESSQCVECQLFGKCTPTSGINLGPFDFRVSLNDIIGLVSTSLLAILLVFFGFKIIFAGYKWINNDAQDKSKKEAIKSLTNGVIGMGIALAAYLIVVVVRGFFGVGSSEQLVNCANLYVADYNVNWVAGAYSNTTDQFQRCIRLSGKDQKFNPNVNAGNWTTFKVNFNNNCSQKYYTVVALKVIVSDQAKMQECFVEQINNLP